MGDWLRAPASRDSEGNILVGQQKGKIKEFVAKAIWGQHWERHKDEITDAALDYFFGNQDGKLADNETISITDLNKRLEFMIPIFSTQAAAGGNSAASYLETKNIILVEYKPEYLSGVNFGALAKAKDPMLMTCLSLAYSKYKPETNEEALAAREAMILAEKGDGSFYSKMPEKMKQQLFAAYWGAFQYECLKNGRKIPENYKDDQNYVKNLIGGAFLNWVDGKLPNAKPGETGRILPDSLESDAVKGAKEYRDKQVGNAAEAARKESESKGNIPVPSDK